MFILIAVLMYARAMKPAWSVSLNEFLKPYSLFIYPPILIYLAVFKYKKMRSTKSKIEKFYYFLLICWFMFLIPFIVIKIFSELN